MLKGLLLVWIGWISCYWGWVSQFCSVTLSGPWLLSFTFCLCLNVDCLKSKLSTEERIRYNFETRSRDFL